MIGEVVGNYRVLRKLGSGGMGEVWVAEHVLLGQKVAIKFLLPEITKHEGIVKRFFDEARAATQIADPGIVAVHDFGWHIAGAYIVMEYLAGEALSSRLRTRPPSLTQALRIGQQIALTMAVAHGRGIIHRDLKPDNIFLVPDAAMPGGERVKVLDFGIAKLIIDEGTASNTHSGVVMGTPTYMSPEQCRGAAGVDHRTDVYALGCILFELVCGRLPFVQPTSSDMIASHLLEQPKPPSAIDPAVPPAVDAILLRCLAKSPGDRFDTMTDLARALAAAAGTPLEVSTIAPIRSSGRRAVDPLEPTRSPTTLAHGAAESIAGPVRRRGPKIVVTLSVVLVAAIVSLILVSRDQPSAVGPNTQPVGSEAGTSIPPVDAAPIDSPPDAVVRDAPAAAIDASLKKPSERRLRGSNELYDNR